MRLADSFTMCQTAFTVMPSPHVLPPLLTRRNSFPRSITAAASQSSSSVLTQSGTGTVRTWPPLPIRSAFSFQSLRIGCLPKCLALLRSQPIAEAHSQLLHAFNTANASRQIGAEETAVGGLGCEPAHGTET